MLFRARNLSNVQVSGPPFPCNFVYKVLTSAKLLTSAKVLTSALITQVYRQNLLQ